MALHKFAALTSDFKKGRRKKKFADVRDVDKKIMIMILIKYSNAAVKRNDRDPSARLRASSARISHS